MATSGGSVSILQILALSYSLAVGYDPNAFWQYDTTPPQLVQNGWAKANEAIPLYIDLQAKVTLQPWGAHRPSVFVGGGIRNDFYPDGGSVYFQPWQDTYTFRAGFQWGPLELQYRHTCYHPVTPYATLAYLDGATIPIPRSEGAIDDFSITFKGTIGGK